MSVLVVLLAIAAGVLVAKRPAVVPSAPESQVGEEGDRTFMLACDTKKSMTITFHLPEDKSVDVVLSDGRTLSLANTSTDSVASYTSTDGVFVLGLTGSTLTLAESGMPTYANCTLASSVTGA